MTQKPRKMIHSLFYKKNKENLSFKNKRVEHPLGEGEREINVQIQNSKVTKKLNF